MRSPWSVIIGVAMCSWPTLAYGQDPINGDSVRVYLLEPLTVEGRVDDLAGIASSASVGYVGRRDLAVRPLSREGELLETVPGMILTQHSGSGKSNQMFVRGFNLDHGTDFATWLDGMPLNIATHAHGQGYTDLNFIVPELVDHIEYSLGNYDARTGDFGSAGSAHMRLRQRLERPLVSIGLGAYGQRRVVGAASTDLGGAGVLLAGGELRGYDGPWELPEELGKRSGMVRYTHQGRQTRWSLLALGYENSWQASDQIPQRAISSGLVSRFGQIDRTLGGATSRYSVSSTWSRSVGSNSQLIEAYAVRYGLDLYSNFTYLLDDPAAGDQFRQHDDGRWTYGGKLASRHGFRALGHAHQIEIGTQFRADHASVSLARTDERAVRETVRADRVGQRSGGAYVEMASAWRPWLRTTAGLRGDLYRFAVRNRIAANTGSVVDGIVSPKASVALGPSRSTEVYLSGGFGFHSNDGRGVLTTIDPVSGDPTSPVDPLAQSWGAEAGIRTSPLGGLRSTLVLWTIRLDSELLFVGDAGATEPSGPSGRTGISLTNFYRFDSEWSADLDASLTQARFRGVPASRSRIPGALEDVIAAGLSREPTENGWLAALRLRRFGSYPLTEDGRERASASSLVNARIGYRHGNLGLVVSVLNVLDEEDSDIQYFYRSRLLGEPVGGVQDLHVHPAEPRQLRVSLNWGM